MNYIDKVNIKGDEYKIRDTATKDDLINLNYTLNKILPLTKKTGKIITLNNTDNISLSGLTIYGKSYQNIEPSPQLWDASNMVVLTGDQNDVNVSGTANGAYIVQGTATADRYIYDYDGMYSRTPVLPAGNYTVSANEDMMIEVRAYSKVDDPDAEDGWYAVYGLVGYGNPVIFSLDKETHISVNLLVPKNKQININNGYIMLVSGISPKPFQEYTGSDPVPSPTHPRAIANVGADGSVVVAVENKNLLDVSRLSGGVTLAGVTATASGGVVNFSGTPTGSAFFYGNEMTLPAGTYTISRNALARNVANQVEIYADDITIPLSVQSYTFHGESGTFTLDHDARIRAGVHVMNFGVSMDGVSISLMLEPGASATGFAAHVDPVETALPLPNAYGLPGIKVSDGGTYSDESGQAWIADTVDFLAYKYTQRIGHITNYAGETIPGAYWSTTGELSTGAEVYYVLANPVESTLTDEALAAFRHVQTVNGTTVVWVNDELSPVIEAATLSKAADALATSQAIIAAETNLAALTSSVEQNTIDIINKIEEKDIFGEVTSEITVLNPTWASGNITSSGNYSSSARGGNYYACTTTFLSSDKTITLNIHDGVAYRYYWYSKTSGSYISGIGLQKTTGERTVTLDNTYKYRVELISYNGTTADGALETTDSIIASIGTYINISYSTIVQHDAIVTKSALEKIGIKTIGGKLVSDIGKTYDIDSFSTTGNVYADFQSNMVKESKNALRICVRGVASESGDTVTTRGTVTLNLQTFTILDSLSMWCMIPSRYVMPNTTRDLHDYTCDPTLTYEFYNGDSLVYSMKEQPRNSMGWRCGWDFHKFVYNHNGNEIYGNFKNKTINKIVISVGTKNSSPDFEMYIDSIVVDRRLTPVFCYNADYDFSDDASLELARYLYINRIPANVRIDLSTDISSIANTDLTSMTVAEMRNVGITAKMVILKGYYEGLFDFNVYTNAAFNMPFVEAKNWLKSSSTNSFALDVIEAAGANVGNNPVRPIICAANWQHKLDDTLKLAEEEVGFKAIRGLGRMTFFVDNIANVIATAPAGQNYNSVSELTNEWINNTASSIKQMIDNAVTYGSIYNLFSHKCYPVSSIVEVTSSPIIPFEVMKEVIDYVVTLRNSGVISTMTMDGVYNCSVN